MSEHEAGGGSAAEPAGAVAAGVEPEAIDYGAGGTGVGLGLTDGSGGMSEVDAEELDVYEAELAEAENPMDDPYEQQMLDEYGGAVNPFVEEPEGPPGVMAGGAPGVAGAGSGPAGLGGAGGAGAAGQGIPDPQEVAEYVEEEQIEQQEANELTSEGTDTFEQSMAQAQSFDAEMFGDT